MSLRFCIVAFLLALAAFAFDAAAQSGSPAKPAAGTHSSSMANESAEGEKRFQTHCGRCHIPPQDLSRREARAVLRQMRVRAMLSAEDERLILKYLAP